MRPRLAILALLPALLAAAPAAATERGIVYSKILQEEPVLEGGLYVLREKRPQRLTYDPRDVEPNVARDGAIAFVRDGDLHLIRPDGTGLRQLTAGPEIDERPLFSPDGRSLAFTRRAAPGAPRDLFLLRLDGAPPLALTSTPEDEADAAFSPDGDRIAFARRLLLTGDEGGGDLYSVRSDGGGLRQLTRTPQQEFGPRYFVGGIVFNRQGDGAVRIFTMRRNGSGVKAAVSPKRGATIAGLTPNGRRLAFRSRGSFWSKRLDRRGAPAKWLSETFGGDELAISPDGRRGAFLLYFDEQQAITTLDLRRGGFVDTAEHYNLGEGGIDPRLAW
ncbi:MAG TPA: hypothetical protein VN179_08825 [Solirubrobacterales bacterium]|nr:hypothetical protein [Solirubrobacterales bacterium]